MRINVNVLLGILLCVLLVVIGGTMYRMSEEEDTWRPNDIYTHVGDVSSADMPTYSHSHSSDEVAVVLRELSRPSRRYAAAPAFSYAQGYSAPMANSQSPIANSSTGVLYTTSSAMTKSFGSGYGAGGSMSMSSGSVRNNQSPLVSNQSPIAYSQLPVDMYASAYTPLASPITTVGANSVAALPARSGMMSGPRRIGGTGSGWDNWLKSLDDEGGYLYSDEDGNRYYDMALLEQAFYAAQQKGNFPGWTWKDFLDYYFTPSGKHFVPVGEPWVLLILALAYVGYVFIRRTRAREV
jgi:hypothetical protein